MLTDITGIGKKSDLVVIGNGYALNFLLPQKKALVATPAVRKRYAEEIKRRAHERELERNRQTGAAAAVAGKKIIIKKKTTKTGRLYAAVSEKEICAELHKQLNIELDEKAVNIAEHIKTTGESIVTLKIGDKEERLKVIIEEKKEDKEEKS